MGCVELPYMRVIEELSQLDPYVAWGERRRQMLALIIVPRAVGSYAHDVATLVPGAPEATDFFVLSIKGSGPLEDEVLPLAVAEVTDPFNRRDRRSASDRCRRYCGWGRGWQIVDLWGSRGHFPQVFQNAQ